MHDEKQMTKRDLMAKGFSRRQAVKILAGNYHVEDEPKMRYVVTCPTPKRKRKKGGEENERD